MNIRTAQRSDLDEILEIYNYEVKNGVATFDIEEKNITEYEIWFNEHNIDNHPLIVAEIEGKIAGYASLSSYRSKEAYKATVELSVYVNPDFRKQGVATALMENIIEAARNDNSIHNIVSVITTGNEASIKLHEKFGFEYCGTIKEVGLKFNRFLSIDNFCLLLD